MKILSHTLDYLEKKFPEVKIDKRAKITQFWCPFCKKVSCQIIPHSGYKLICHACGNGQSMGTIIDVMKKLHNMSEEEIVNDMKKVLKIEIVTEKEEINLLDFYVSQGFDLVPIASNQKIPVEKDWTNKTHKDKMEWIDWLHNGMNIGVKTGKKSNVTVIDIDKLPVPEPIASWLKNVKTLTQITNKGIHLFFKYDSDIPKSRIDRLQVDIENDGGQVVVSPSKVEDKNREMIIVPIADMPKELKDFLLTETKSIKLITTLNTEEKLMQDIKTEDFNIGIIQEGNRNNVFIRLGGILRKAFDITQTKNILNLLNKHFCNPSLSGREFDNIITQLDKYTEYDDRIIANKILQHLLIVEEANARDIKDSLGFTKKKVEDTLSYLLKEQYVIKKRGRFHIIKKVQWKDTFMDEGKEIDFKMPYFYDHATFRYGDMLVIGAKQKVGKSHIALNIVKRLVAQGKKPYYINLESGNRFATISKSLGLVEGDYWNATHFAPEQVELEKDSITIIDWLLPDDYAETDKLYKYFAQQLVKNGGTLIIFVQLKNNGDFFAPNMMAFFPAFVCRYFYVDEARGTEGSFTIDYMREPKFNVKKASIPCVYDWATKELKRVDEMQDNNLNDFGDIPDSI